MSLVDIARLLLRRWPVVLVVALLTGAGAAFVFTAAQDTWTVDTSLLVEPIEVDEVDALSTAAVLAQTLDSGEAREEIASVGGTAPYETVADGDFLLIRATSESVPTATTTVDAVIERLETQLPLVAQDFGTSVQDVGAEVVATPGVQSLSPEGIATVAASVLIIEPPLPANPFSNGDYAAQVTLAATETSIASGELEIGPSSEVTVDSDLRQPAPLIDVVVTSVDADRARELYGDTVEVLTTNLERLQEEAGVTGSRRTGLRPLQPDVDPVRTPATPLRPVVFILALGLVVMVLGSLAADAIAERREDRDSPQKKSRQRQPSRATK